MGICLTTLLQGNKDLNSESGMPQFKKRGEEEEDEEEEMLEENQIQAIAVLDRSTILNLELSYQSKGLEESQQKISITDFDFIKVLGRGSFGKVLLVQKKEYLSQFIISPTAPSSSTP